MAKKKTKAKIKKAVKKVAKLSKKAVKASKKVAKKAIKKVVKPSKKIVKASKKAIKSKSSLKKIVSSKKKNVVKPIKKKAQSKAPLKKSAPKAKIVVKPIVEAKLVIANPEKVSKRQSKKVAQEPVFAKIELNPLFSKVKSILVSQPRPENDRSPYIDIAKKYNLKVDFREFIKVEGVSAKEFRQKRISILDHGAVILNSRNAVDHYFRMCSEMRIMVPDAMKYFCNSEATAYYLQKYVQFRKRKIFHGKQSLKDLGETMKKHKDDRFLFPCSESHKEDIIDWLDELKIRYSKAIMFRATCSDLSDLADVNYDVLVFFSPAGIKSLYQNFPDFKQNNTRIAIFGSTTAKAVQDAKLRIDLYSPTLEAPSMPTALENYIKIVSKK